MVGRSLKPQRLANPMRAAIERCELDLTDRHVVTEAATGAFAVTSVLAALAGAQVTALARSTRYGTVAEVRDWTTAVAAPLGIGDRLQVVDALTPEQLAAADVVTNSGHLRPLDQSFVDQLSPGAVVPLMMEAWEIGAGRTDVDLDALRRRGIAFAGTNERNPAVGVFDFLGVMAVKLLVDAGVAVQHSHLALLCDNPFRDYLEATLRSCGATVTTLTAAADLAELAVQDAVVVACTPTGEPNVRGEHLSVLADRMPGVVVAQFYGDVDRKAAAELEVDVWPILAPLPGHMGVLPSDIGPEPIVRLQAGGLKVGQVLLTPRAERTDSERAFLDVL